MKVYGLMSWYQESAIWLASAVAAASKICDHIIAVDGAYFLYPDGRPRSGPEQSAIIQDVASAHGMGCTIHTPDSVWMENEIEKRNFLFSLANLVSERGKDWYFILDADMVIDNVPEDWRDQLKATDKDVAEITMSERDEVFSTEAKANAARSMDWPTNTYPFRAFYRAQPITVKFNHYTYLTEDDRILWGNNVANMEEAHDLTLLTVDHRTNYREVSRRKAAKSYYKRRDELGLEHDRCGWQDCGSWGTKVLPFNWEVDGDALAANNITVCDEHYDQAKQASDDQVRALGRDPEGLALRGPAA